MEFVDDPSGSWVTEMPPPPLPSQGLHCIPSGCGRVFVHLTVFHRPTISAFRHHRAGSSSSYWASVANAPNVLQPYWLIVLPLDVPALTASLLL